MAEKKTKKLTPRQLAARRAGRAFMKAAREWTRAQRQKDAAMLALFEAARAAKAGQ